MIVIVGWVGAAASTLAAFFWLWASMVRVEDNMDAFISCIQKASRLNALGAAFSCLAAICAAWAFAASSF